MHIPLRNWDGSNPTKGEYPDFKAPKFCFFFPGHATPPRRQSHTPARAAGGDGDFQWLVMAFLNLKGHKHGHCSRRDWRKYVKQMWPETEEVLYVMRCDAMRCRRHSLCGKKWKVWCYPFAQDSPLSLAQRGIVKASWCMIWREFQNQKVTSKHCSSIMVSCLWEVPLDRYMYLSRIVKLRGKPCRTFFWPWKVPIFLSFKVAQIQEQLEALKDTWIRFWDLGKWAKFWGYFGIRFFSFKMSTHRWIFSLRIGVNPCSPSRPRPHADWEVGGFQKTHQDPLY